jgi:hypothetical protein
MQTRSRSVATVVAVLAAMCALVIPAGAAGAATAVPLRGGITSVTSSPGVTAALLRAGVLPLPTGRAQEGLVLQPGGLGVKASFPVTGGSVDPATLAGDVQHQGGLKFVNFRTFQTVSVADFTIVIDASPHLVATEVNGKPAALRVFDLDLSKAKVASGPSGIQVTGIVPILTSDAAAALNASLGTTVFAGGLVFGTGQTRLVPAA